MTQSTDRPVRPWRVRGRPGAAWAAGLLLTLSLGCGDSETAPETRSPAAPPAASPRAVGPDAIGDVDIGTEGLPDGFPADLPLYPGSEPTRWMAAEGPGSLVVFDSGAKPQLVFDHFTKELPSAGWEVSQTSQAKARHWSVIASKNGRNARISIAPAGAGSQYGIAVADAD